MKFYNAAFLAAHCQSILDFYDPRIIDASGGYFHNFHDDGCHFDPGFRHLVSSTRIVVNYALASHFFNNEKYLEMARHGLAYVETVHWQEQKQGYAWLVQAHQVSDMTQRAYGYAFVMLMYAAVKKAGIIKTDEPLHRLYAMLESRFWQPEHGLYADEISASGELSPYRGQNANMHICEAMIACYEATNDSMFLRRAELIATNIVQRQAALTDNLIWEHYTEDFQPDWEFNKDDPKNIYRPWGFQPGHLTEWSQLLVLLNQYAPQPWLLERAQQLFDHAYKTSWDDEFGGLTYGFAPNGQCCDDDKYFWVQSESFAAAAMLLNATGEFRYMAAYEQLWQYSWEHMIDHQDGAWWWMLKKDNSRYSTQKSVAGAKCDYHTIGACLKTLASMGIHSADDIKRVVVAYA